MDNAVVLVRRGEVSSPENDLLCVFIPLKKEFLIVAQKSSLLLVTVEISVTCLVANFFHFIIRNVFFFYIFASKFK